MKIIQKDLKFPEQTLYHSDKTLIKGINLSETVRFDGSNRMEIAERPVYAIEQLLAVNKIIKEISYYC